LEREGKARNKYFLYMKKVEIPDYGKQTKGAFNRTRQDVRLSDKLIFPSLLSRVGVEIKNSNF
jgi:hypothetical protein